MTFYCDRKRHLVCVPYSIDNLHKMACQLNINRCFFDFKSKSGNIHAHYDIPVRRIKEIMKSVTLVDRRVILQIIKHKIQDNGLLRYSTT